MSKYEDYTEHVTHYTPCMLSNPVTNVSPARSPASYNFFLNSCVICLIWFSSCICM